MKNKLSITSIKSYEFKGTWLDPQLTYDQLVALGLKEIPGEIAIEGTYSVHWDDDIPLVEVDIVYAVGAQNGTYTAIKPIRDGLFNYKFENVELPKYKEIIIEESQLDRGTIEDLIQEHDDGTWAQDRDEDSYDR